MQYVFSFLMLNFHQRKYIHFNDSFYFQMFYISQPLRVVSLRREYKIKK